MKGPGLDQIRIEVKSGGRLHYLRFSPSGELTGHTVRVPATIDVPLAQ